jgi:hypothetical protein
MPNSFCRTCGQPIIEKPKLKQWLQLRQDLVRQIHGDHRKRTWIARELRLSIRIITGIKSLPIEAAIEKYCK